MSIPAIFKVDELVAAATLVDNPNADTSDVKDLLINRKAIIAVLLWPDTMVTQAVWVEHQEWIKQALIGKFPSLKEVLDGLYTFRTVSDGGPKIEKNVDTIRKLYRRAEEILGWTTVSLN
jgi:hypothetical protein